jgi:nitronate monooxygenase
LGASAAQVGTGFLRAPEAGIHAAWAEALATAAPEDTSSAGRSVGARVAVWQPITCAPLFPIRRHHPRPTRCSAVSPPRCEWPPQKRET